MSERETRSGRCLCGKTSFAYEGEERFMAHCHCESCRRQTASPFTTYLGVPDGQWRWTGESPRTYASSPGVTRSFCGNCGTPMAYRAERFGAEIHFFAATLDQQEHVRPTVHVHTDERVAWVELGDDLPRK